MSKKMQWVVGSLLGLAVVLGEGYAVVYALPRWSCDQKFEGSGFEYRFRVGGGCQVRVSGKFVPQDAIANIRLEH